MISYSILTYTSLVCRQPSLLEVIMDHATAIIECRAQKFRPRSPQDHRDWQIENCKSILRNGLEHAYRVMAPAVDLTIKYCVSPKFAVQKVLANRRFEQGQLTLVPLSLAVGLCAPHKVPTSAVLVPNAPNCPGDLSAYVSPSMCYPDQPNSKKDPFVVPFWAIPAAATPDGHNVVPGKLRIDVQACSDKRGNACKHTMHVPVLYNTEPIEKGAMILKPQPGTGAGVATPPKPSSTAKRSVAGAHSSAPKAAKTGKQ